MLSGPVVSGDRLLFTMRERPVKGKSTDVLTAVNLKDVEIEWQFRDGGQFPSGVSAFGMNVFLPISDGSVARF